MASAPLALVAANVVLRPPFVVLDVSAVYHILCSDVHQVVCVYFVVALRRSEIEIRYGSRGVDILGLRTLPT